MDIEIEKVVDFDVVFLSYDEPNADENYEDLLTKIPWAKRIHGVYGSDSAHKACAEISETDRVVIIDGDNRVDKDFLNQEIHFDAGSDMTKTVYSWCARNHINGLIYGNGGIKCWPRQLILDMKTHENADPNNAKTQVDFCWEIVYYAQERVMSYIYNNSTPQQAWRAGFREGVKMALNEGNKPTKQKFVNGHWKNLHRLYIWTMIGADVDHGIWAIYGARQGLYKTMCSDWNYINVRDFDYLDQLWQEVSKNFDTAAGVIKDTMIYGDMLKHELDIPISVNPLDKEQSKFFKTVYLNPKRNTDGFLV